MKNRLNAILVLIGTALLIALLLGFTFKALTAAFVALMCVFSVMALLLVFIVWRNYLMEKEPPL